MKQIILNRKVLMILLAICLALPLFASGEAEATSESDIVELNVFSYQFSNQQAYAEDMANAYMEAHPNIKITVEEYPWNTYFQNLEVRFNADNPNLDVIVMDIPMMAGYAERGFIEDMTDYIPKSEFTSKVAAGSLAAITYNGKIMSSPLQNSDQYLYINLDMAKEAGIKLPTTVVDANTVITEEYAKIWGDSAWTWEETVNAAMKMVKDTNGDGITDVYGLHIEQAGRLYQLQPLGGSRGGSIVSPDGFTVRGYLDQDVWLKAVQFYADLFNKYKVEDPSCFVPGYDNGTEFMNGKFAMMLGGGWNLDNFLESGMNLVVAAHPHFADGKTTTPTGSWVAGVSSSASEKNKEAAAEFVQWWTLSEEGTELWYDLANELPATKYMLDQLSTNPKFDTFPLSAQRLGVYQVLNTAEGRPVTPFYAFVNEGFDKAFVDAAQGVDPKKALMEAVDLIEKNIERVK
jgi:ABC-type glycerol-3-phosphate transport system substrate-binding protein